MVQHCNLLLGEYHRAACQKDAIEVWNEFKNPAIYPLYQIATILEIVAI